MNKLALFSSFFLSLTTVLDGLAANADPSQGACDYSVVQLEARFHYFAQLAIVVTNHTEQDVRVHHLSGSPFSFEFVEKTNRVRLHHKADVYFLQKGVTTAGEWRLIPTHSFTPFYVDLLGDYVVESGRRYVRCQEWLHDKKGILVISPINAKTFRVKEATRIEYPAKKGTR